MNAIKSCIMVSAIAFFGLLVLPVVAQTEKVCRPSHETTVAAVVYKGDNVIVRTDDAALMVGREVVARLSSGQKFAVTTIQGTWLGTSVTIGGRSLSGWVQSTDVMLARTDSNEKSNVADLPVIRHEKTNVPGRLTAFQRAAGEAESQPAAAPVPADAVAPYGEQTESVARGNQGTQWEPGGNFRWRRSQPGTPAGEVHIPQHADNAPSRWGPTPAL